MFNCIKNCLSFSNLFKSAKNDVKIYNNIFIAHKNENNVFKKTLDYFDNSKINLKKNYEDSFVRKFYYFELLTELLNRYKKEINISENSLSYVNSAFEELNLSFRFNMIWYYDSANIHLRMFIENIINFVYYHFWDIGIVTTNDRDWNKVKIEKCFKVWQRSFKNLNIEEKETYDEYYFNIDEFYKIYKHLSEKYIHKSYKNWMSNFKEEELNHFHVTFSLSLMFSARFIKTTMGLDIEKVWGNRVLNQIEDYPHYWNYLQFLFNENKIFTNQFSWLYNLIFDNKKKNYNLIIEEIWLDLDMLFTSKFLNDNR